MQKNKSVLVCGYGRIGKALVHYLSTLGYRVYVVDTQFTVRPPIGILAMTVKDTLDIEYSIQTLGPDLVVSSLPYFENIKLAYICLLNDVGYMDLGGHVETSQKIKKIVEGKAIPVFTDCGLAPGLINIVTERLLKGYEPSTVQSVECLVGGIPRKAIDPPFNYHVTWSIDGLLNEYFDDVEILQNGEIVTVGGLTNLQQEYSQVLNLNLESFRTSGASAHTVRSLKEKGVKDFEYRTLRYPGHREFLYLMKSMAWENFSSVIQRLSDTAPCKEDIVIGIAKVYNNATTLERVEFVIRPDSGYSAMQVATAAPTAIIAGMILDKHLPRRYLTYSDVVPHYFYFGHMLDKLGVDIG